MMGRGRFVEGKRSGNRRGQPVSYTTLRDTISLCFNRCPLATLFSVDALSDDPVVGLPAMVI